MELIVGDIGNTFSKICLINEKSNKIIKILNIKTKEIKTTRDLKIFFNKKKLLNRNLFFKNALFSSVVPSTFLLFKNFLKKEFKIKSYDIKEKNIKKIIKIKIKNPSQVGSDRIANASGVSRIYKSNCIIIDFGTATTFDVVTKQGVYKGGIIAPGIELSMINLYKATAQLPFLKIKKIKKIIGKNTLEAMHSGFFWGYLGLIVNIIKGIKKETKKNYKLICTGGLANLFAKAINKKAIVDKNLTIKGIFEIYKLNKKFFLKNG